MFNFKKPVCESPYHCTVISVSLANMSFLDAGEKHYKCIFVDEGGFKLLNKGRSEFHWPVSNHRSTVGLVSSCITEDGGVGWNFFIGIECRIPWQLFRAIGMTCHFGEQCQVLSCLAEAGLLSDQSTYGVPGDFTAIFTLWKAYQWGQIGLFSRPVLALGTHVWKPWSSLFRYKAQTKNLSTDDLLVIRLLDLKCSKMHQNHKDIQ